MELCRELNCQRFISNKLFRKTTRLRAITTCIKQLLNAGSITALHPVRNKKNNNKVRLLDLELIKYTII